MDNLNKYYKLNIKIIIYHIIFLFIALIGPNLDAFIPKISSFFAKSFSFY